jgi:hypothetical protein
MPLSLPPIHGVNFGGWLSQSPLTPAHLAGFVTEADFQAVKEAGFNTVRLPFNAQLVWDPERGLLEEGAAWLDRAVAWAESRGLILILDLHQVPGHSFVDASQNNIYSDAERRRQARRLWAALAGRYVGRGDGLLFELLNEPVAPSAEVWRRLAEDLLASIRGVDERRPVVFGPNLWNGPAGFAGLEPFDDERIVYTFHFYEPHSFTHQGAPWVRWAKDLPVQHYPGEPVGLREALAAADVQAHAQADHIFHPWDKAALARMLEPVAAFRAAHKVPVFCGEFGVYLRAPRPDQLRWLEDLLALLAESGFGFTYWNWRGMDYGLYYEEGKWAAAPQYQGPLKRDEEVLALLQGAARRLGRA